MYIMFCCKYMYVLLCLVLYHYKEEYSYTVAITFLAPGFLMLAY